MVRFSSIYKTEDKERAELRNKKAQKLAKRDNDGNTKYQ